MSRVLKAHPESSQVDLATYSFGDLADATRSSLQAARQEAAETVAAARREAEYIRSVAEAEGLAAAEAKAEQLLTDRVKSQLATLMPALEQAVTSVVAARADCLLRWEAAAIEVAVAIAERVIRCEVAHKPEISLSLVREALELAAGSKDLQLRMHPDDLEILRPQVETLLAQLTPAGSDALLPDPSISRGGCRVETRSGTIDQQIEAQLARIEQELR